MRGKSLHHNIESLRFIHSDGNACLCAPSPALVHNLAWYLKGFQ